MDFKVVSKFFTIICNPIMNNLQSKGLCIVPFFSCDRGIEVELLAKYLSIYFHIPNMLCHIFLQKNWAYLAPTGSV